MKVIVGLGNPELKYMNTRHNAGFWLVDKLATTCGARFEPGKKLFCDVAKTDLAGQQVLLVKPDTYMNNSGQAVQAVLHWYKIDPADLLVAHDDVSLPLGRLRFQKGGGAGGQHGVESIIETLGGRQDFQRLKIGVGPDPGGDERAHYVLSPVPEADAPMRDQMIEICAKGLGTYLKFGIQQAMNEFNAVDLRPKPPKPEKPKKPEQSANLESVDSANEVNRPPDSQHDEAEAAKRSNL